MKVLIVLLGIGIVISFEMPCCRAIDPALIKVAREKGLVIQEIPVGNTKYYDVCIKGKIADEQITILKEATPIQNFAGIGVSNIDQVCKELKFTDLQSVFIVSSRLTNNGLKSVLQCPTIHSVLLNGADITDEGCEYFRALPILANVTLQNVKIGNNGVKYISDCKSIKHVSLLKCAIDDEGVAMLTKLMELEYLSLGECKVTNVSMSHLSSCGSLRHLSLKNVAIDKSGLMEVLENPELKSLTLREMRVEADAIDALRVRYPRIEISTSPPLGLRMRKPMEGKKKE